MVTVGPKTASTCKRPLRQPKQSQPCWDASYRVELSKQRTSFQLDFALFWNCHCVTWGLAWPILFHVTGSSKRPLIASCGAIFQKSLQQANMYGISRLDWRVSKMWNKKTCKKKCNLRKWKIPGKQDYNVTKNQFQFEQFVKQKNCHLKFSAATSLSIVKTKTFTFYNPFLSW